MSGYVREAALEDAVYLSTCMRQEDVDEIKLSHNVEPLEGLLSSFQLKNSKVFSIIGSNKECVGMFGVSDCPFVEKYGVAWMLSSDSLNADTRQFLKECRGWVNVLNEQYDIIYNWVHPDNWKTLKWLQFCGFKPKTKHKYGINNEEFLLVMREKNV
tara:strand:- start:7439 stop:7909 length:471 start_codon:yes stop_codon:yes gene_type:complete